MGALIRYIPSLRGIGLSGGLWVLNAVALVSVLVVENGMTTPVTTMTSVVVWALTTDRIRT